MNLILIDEIPENPCIIGRCPDEITISCYECGQQSILSKAIPIEKLDEVLEQYRNSDYMSKTFSQFLQEQLGVK